MNKNHLQRSIPAALLTALAAIPSGSALAATHTSAHTAAQKQTAKSKTKTKTVKGPVVDMRWGPVQAIVKVKGKKITDVKINVSPDTSRSQFIDDNSVPMLRQETLKAQNANIDLVSGATMTSEAFVESLQGALVKAHISK